MVRYSSEQKVLLAAVEQGTLKQVTEVFHSTRVENDKNWFDYFVLTTALQRKHKGIINFLLKNECRVRKEDSNRQKSPLYYAIELGDISIIKRIIKKGAYPKVEPYNENSPLYSAMTKKQYSIVDCIILSMCNFEHVNPENQDDLAHFHIACIRGQLDVMKIFMNRGFPVNGCPADSLNINEWPGFTPLHFSVKNRCGNTFEFLLDHGADLSANDSNNHSPLHIAYNEGFILDRILSTLRSMPVKKISNSVDGNGLSIFHICCLFNISNMVQMFLDAGVDVDSSVNLNSPDYSGYTALHFVVKCRYIEIVELLLKRGASTAKTDGTGCTPLHLACQFSIDDIADLLLEHGADLNQPDNENRTPLHYAFYTDKKHHILDLLLKRIPTDINPADSRGLTHFHIACTRNNVNKVKKFLENGVSVDLRVNSNGKEDSGYSALHFAAFWNRKNIVQLLLKHNANVNALAEDPGDSIWCEPGIWKPSRTKVTPLHLACRHTYSKFNHLSSVSKKNWSFHSKNQIGITELLLHHKADVNAKDSAGESPLIHACRIEISNSRSHFTNEIENTQNEIIAALLRYNADIHVHSDSSKYVLHMACHRNIFDETIYRQGHVEFAEIFLENGANVHVTMKDGTTPLHLAVEYGHERLVLLFLKYNANTEAKTDAGLTALHVAASSDDTSDTNESIIDILLRNGSDVNARCMEGESPLHKAFLHLNRFAVEQLLRYGADINGEDIFGNPTFDGIFLTAEFGADGELDCEMLELVDIHLQKLTAVKYSVSENTKKCFSRLQLLLREAHFDEPIGISHNISVRCAKECEKLKSVKIDRYSSLYDVLCSGESEMAKRVNNEKLESIIAASSFENDFPLFNDLLALQFKRGVARSALLESAKISLETIIGLSLPDFCHECILKHLSHNDIHNLLQAEPKIDALKRKLDSNAESDEPVRKQQQLI